MANSQRPIVNQRLYFCRLHLQWLEQQLEGEEIPRRVLEQSLGESILFHLVVAYRAYLAEIATAYTASSSASFSDASELVAALEAQGYSSAEARELQQLEQGNSWLAELLSGYQTLGGVEQSVKSSAPQMITAFEVDASQKIDLDSASDYFQALNAVIENQRSRLEEW